MTSAADTIQRILPLLEEAEQIASGYSGGHSAHFKSAEAFTQALHNAILKLKFRDTSEVPVMKKWFAPGADWESMIGPQGITVGKQIHELLPEIHLTHIKGKHFPRRSSVWDWIIILLQALFEAL